jgi:hypothetical protein
MARLDSSELDHQIEALGYQIAIAAEKSQAALDHAAAGDLTKVSERRRMVLKQRSLECDLRYLHHQRRALEICAPIAGRVATAEPDAMVGRSAIAGEALFHISALPRAPQS